MPDELMAIEPYWYGYTWVFDDTSKGFERQPLDVGPEDLGHLSGRIDLLVMDIPDARDGFTLIFSSQPFAGYQVELTWIGSEGCSYRLKDTKTCLCFSPALASYFETPPESLYVKAEPRRDKYDPFEVIALKDKIDKLERIVGKLTLENEALRMGRNKNS